MIVKMKRLRLMGLQADRDILLRRLMALGCVELRAGPERDTGPAPEQESRLAELQEKLQLLQEALEVLKRYAPEKGRLFQEKDAVSRDVFFSDGVTQRGLALADDLLLHDERIQRLHTMIAHAKENRTAILPWQHLEVPLNTRETEHAIFLLGTVPLTADPEQVRETLAHISPDAALYHVGSTKQEHCLMAVCHRAVHDDILHTLKELGFSEAIFDRAITGTGPQSMTALVHESEKAAAELEVLKEEIAVLGKQRAELKLCIDRLTQEVILEEAKKKVQTQDAKFTLEGWFSAPQEPELTALLSEFSCTWEQSDPTPAEYHQVPVKLQGNRITRPLNMVTEMYGLPAYDGIDPNGLIMPFFSIFFGIMYADLGYGLVLLAISLFLFFRRKRLSRGLQQAAGLLFQVSITTAVFGALFGGFFGDAIPMFSETFLARRIDMWALINPMENPLFLMMGALVLGGIQILIGMCVRVYLCFRDGRPLDAVFDVGTWWLLFGGIALLALGHGPWLAVAGVVSIIAFQGRHAPTVLGKIFGGVGKLYSLVNYLSDILSYLRLMALFLATGVIASVFNMLGSLLGDGLGGGILGIVGFIVVFLVGHVFNMGINIIGTYVHTIRLQYLEFFGQFYKEGGRPFRPLFINTKYYDITE
ncbi:MAG: V-type ATP synthase subunit I [Oscillospiraceae bacterium]|nr:V-type ATP synthase subunit I [Oscillospiraceae bacterium]